MHSLKLLTSTPSRKAMVIGGIIAIIGTAFFLFLYATRTSGEAGLSVLIVPWIIFVGPTDWILRNFRLEWLCGSEQPMSLIFIVSMTAVNSFIGAIFAFLIANAWFRVRPFFTVK